MLVESFLTKIALAVFEQALISAEIPILSKAVQIFSIFQNAAGVVNQIKSINSSEQLRVHNLEVFSDRIANDTADYLINLGKETFEVNKTDSGVYVASNIRPTFRSSQLEMVYNQIQFQRKSEGGALKRISDIGKFTKKQ